MTDIPIHPESERQLKLILPLSGPTVALRPVDTATEKLLKRSLDAIRQPLPDWGFVDSNYLYLGLIQEDGREADYGGYRRLQLPRTATFWKVEKGRAVNLLPLEFPTASGGFNVLVGFGFSSTREGSFFLMGRLAQPLRITMNVVPAFSKGGVQITQEHFVNVAKIVRG